MKHFFSVADAGGLSQIVSEAFTQKKAPFAHAALGKHQTLGLVFLNPSLRTRLSTQKAAMNLGMDVMIMNMDKDGWSLETHDNVIMNGTKAEHIREAAAVMGSYCDILGLRSFPQLKDADEDYSEDLFLKFMAYCGKPVVSLESATLHPLQSLADLMTIIEHGAFTFNGKTGNYEPKTKKPKVVLTWAPHVKALPQAVPNSFSEWMCKAQAEGLLDFIIAQPKGYELNERFTAGAQLVYDQEKAFEKADFIYVKNWSSYKEYGQILPAEPHWMPTLKSLENTNDARVMHCLPARRDLELGSDILDSERSLVIPEAGNRVWAAQAVLKRILEAKRTGWKN